MRQGWSRRLKSAACRSNRDFWNTSGADRGRPGEWIWCQGRPSGPSPSTRKFLWSLRRIPHLQQVPCVGRERCSQGPETFRTFRTFRNVPETFQSHGSYVPCQPVSRPCCAMPGHPAQDPSLLHQPAQSLTLIDSASNPSLLSTGPTPAWPRTLQFFGHPTFLQTATLITSIIGAHPPNSITISQARPRHNRLCRAVWHLAGPRHASTDRVAVSA